MPLKLTTRFNRPATLAMPVRSTGVSVLPSVWAAAVATTVALCQRVGGKQQQQVEGEENDSRLDSLGPQQRHGGHCGQCGVTVDSVESVLGLLVNYTFSVLMTRGPPIGLCRTELD